MKIPHILNVSRLITATLLLTTAISGCRKSEFDGERPDVRLSAVLSQYQDQLAGAANGWLGYLYTAGGGGYTFKFKFDKNNRVLMYANINSNTAARAKESSYRLKATQVPSLYFDTYSYIHQLADPDPLQSGGEMGKGLLSDFEFSILSATADTIRLKGNLHSSEMLLIRATDSQGEDFIKNVEAYTRQIDRINHFRYYYQTFSLGGKTYQIAINTSTNVLSFYTTDHGFSMSSIPFAAKENGLVLQRPYRAGAMQVNTLTDFVIDEASGTAAFNLGNERVTLSNTDIPLVVDKAAAGRMFAENYAYRAATGFTINGIEDALGMHVFPGLEGLKYQPRFYAGGYDGCHLYYANGTRYVGTALNTLARGEGTLLFYNLIPWQNNGYELFPDEGVDVVENLMAQLADPEGYYVFQTGQKAYDLVSVANPAVWIRFR